MKARALSLTSVLNGRCCNDTTSPEQTSRGGCCAIQRYRQYWAGGQSGFWYNVRAFEIIGGQGNLALHVSGVVDALAVAPLCLSHLLQEQGMLFQLASTQRLLPAAPKRGLSVECWVRHLDTDDFGDYVSMGEWEAHDIWNSNLTLSSGVHLGMIAGKYCWSVATVGGNAESVCAPEWVTTLSRGNWTHLVGTFDGAEMQLFVNGTKLEPSKALHGDIARPPRDTFQFSLLGMSVRTVDGGEQARSLFGEIDEVRVVLC